MENKKISGIVNQETLDKIKQKYMEAKTPHDAGELLAIHDLLALKNGLKPINYNSNFFKKLGLVEHELDEFSCGSSGAYDVAEYDILIKFRGAKKESEKNPDDEWFEGIVVGLTSALEIVRNLKSKLTDGVV